ncbi:hypothetical protein MP638_000718 [Amoeboaphelidium occidentale]|nr:hypothetical protein MP638_000718 [Amoeboaphelidium occidentale]
MITAKIITLEPTIIEGQPIIRIFGTTKEDQKCLINMRSIYPYIYIKKEDPSMIRSAINKIMQLFYRNTRNYVHDIEVVQKRDFYGYHQEEEEFLKIYLLDFNCINTLAELLLNRAILQKSIQVYGSHVPFTLQFLVDYDLYGMDDIIVTHFEVPQPKASHCEIELDTYPWHISNTAKNSLDALWEEEYQRRLSKGLSVSSLEQRIKAAREQRTKRIVKTESAPPSSIVPLTVTTNPLEVVDEEIIRLTQTSFIDEFIIESSSDSEILEMDDTILQVDGTNDPFFKFNNLFSDDLVEEIDLTTPALFNNPPDVTSPTSVKPLKVSTHKEVHERMIKNCSPKVIHQVPHFSNDTDLRSAKFMNRFKQNDFVPKRAKFEFASANLEQSRAPITGTQLGHILPKEDETLTYGLTMRPPTRRELMKKYTKQPDLYKSRMVQPTRDAPFVQPSNPLKEFDSEGLRIMSLECHVDTRGEYYPDPARDEIKFVCICIDFETVFIAIHDEHVSRKDVFYVRDEEELIDKIIEITIARDPDILCGYEIHKRSWGYLMDRAQIYPYSFKHIAKMLSRVEDSENVKQKTSASDNLRDVENYSFIKHSGVSINGRIVLNVWRIMKQEYTNLTCFTYQNICFHVLHCRVPKYHYSVLTKWYNMSSQRWRVYDYIKEMAVNTIRILHESNVILQTAEFARVYGCDFYSVLSRGSQYKVEAMMLRFLKRENFVAISPTRKQVNKMSAAEALPLVMEPQSGFYCDPIVVLDFQSLYPSIMIANNYCFSTILGKIKPLKRRGLGFLEVFDAPAIENFYTSPNGVAFAKQDVTVGILSKMLTGLLDTRAMIKESMKLYMSDKFLSRVLDSRQLGLKLLANVIYGYTSASFSGRMPCVELADSIVQTGRSTLESTIKFINNHPTWNARVVYGDTDSVFVLMPGSSRERAHKIGIEIAEEITKQHPKPMKLKFEKVYFPSVMLSKKRYCGFKYESLEQEEPEFEGKGIETVRRDGCPAVAKILENSLKILFRTKDLSKIKEYLLNEFTKIMEGNVSLQDFIIAKAVKLGTYSDRGVPPPGAYVSIRRMKEDPRTEPEYGERVPIIISYDGGTNPRLVDAARTPEEFLAPSALNNQHFATGLRLNAEYYITRQILPVLARIFDLVGVDVKAWFHEMSKVDRIVKDSILTSKSGNQTTLEKFYKSKFCVVCLKEPVNAFEKEICSRCLHNPAESIMKIQLRLQEAETRYFSTLEMCKKCVGAKYVPEVANDCVSFECPVWFARSKRLQALRYASKIEESSRNWF